MGGARLWASSIRRRRVATTVFLAVFAGLAGGLVLTSVEVARRTASTLDRFLDQPHLATSIVIACPTGVTEADVEAGGGPGIACGGTDDVLDLAREVAAAPVVGSAVPVGVVVTGIRSGPDRPWSPTIQYVVLGDWPGLPSSPIVVDGRVPTTDTDDEVALNERLADELGVSVGDTIELASFSADEREEAVTQGERAVPSGRTGRPRVVGIVRTADDVAANPEPSVFTTAGWWRMYGSDDLAGYGKGVAVHLRDRSSEVGLDEALRKALPNRLFDISPSQSSTDTTRRVIDLQAGAAWAFALVALVAAFGFVGQTLSRQVSRDLADRDTLSALGMTRGGVAAGVALRILPSALGAGAIAALIAVLASPIGPVGLARELEIAPGIRVDGVVVALGAACVTGSMVLAAVLAGLFVLRRGTRRSSTRVVTLPVATPASTRAGLSFLGRSDRSSTIGAVAGSGLAVAAMVAALSLSSSHHALLASPERFGQTWDVILGDFASQDEMDAGRTAIEDVPGIDGIGQTRSTEASIGDDPLVVVAFVGTDRAVGPTVLEGREPTNDREIALGAITLSEQGLDVGDEVTLRGPVDGEPVGPLRIVGRVVASDGVDAAQSPGRGAVVTNALFDQIDLNSTGQSFLIRAEPGVSTDVLIERLSAAFGGSITPATAPEDIVNLDRVSTVPTLLAVTISVLALTALINALLTLLGRRQRDTAILRSLGFTRGQVLGSVSTVAAVMGSGSVLVGVPLGVILARWGWGLVEARLGVESSVVVPVGGVALIAFAAIIVAQLVALVPGVRATQVGAAEALRAE